MFDKLKGLNLSKTFIDISGVNFEIDKTHLKIDITKFLLSLDSSVDFVDEDNSEIILSFECMYSPIDSDDVGDFMVAEVSLTQYDLELDIEGESLSFELTYPGKFTFDELLSSYNILLKNIFSLIK